MDLKDEQVHTDIHLAEGNGEHDDQLRQTATTVDPKELFAIQTTNIQDPYSNPPTATVRTPQPHPQAYDWSRNLVHLAKTSELKKHALTLQLHTAHILAAHASLDEKGRTLLDVQEQKNRVESERNRLLDSLAQINADRDKLDLSIKALDRDCDEIKREISHITEGDYTMAKQRVDELRQELGHPPLPTLQSIMDERAASYLTERRLKGPSSLPYSLSASEKGSPLERPATTTPSTNHHQRDPETGEPPIKRPRGRPKGSKNKPKGIVD